MIFSCIIPASKKDADSQNLKDLIESIRAQEFPQDQIEIIVVTEGDSESAKAIGIKKAQGEICAMFCADNFITNKKLFPAIHFVMSKMDVIGAYDRHYYHNESDPSLNRYFSLIGINDPIPFYLGKADRKPYYDLAGTEVIYEGVCFENGLLPSLGDNGFFVKREVLLQTNLDHYYPMDVYQDWHNQGKNVYMARMNEAAIWHRTSDNLISFLKKRYRYARDLYCDRTDRRWKMLGKRKDYLRLLGFCLGTAAVIPCLWTSIKGFSKVKDFAWFWHWPVCFGFLITYSILAIRNLFKHGALFQRSASSSQLSNAATA